MVRTYRDSYDYSDDAESLAGQGWTVQNMATTQPSAGLGRILLIGIFAAVVKPKPEIIVTYVRQG